MATAELNQPAPSLAQLQSSLSSLVTASHILDGFAHRNKNQHRATRWWGPFDMLRRSLHKILPELEAALQRAEILSSSSARGIGSKRKRTAGGGGGGTAAPAAAAKQARQPELDRVIERATWMRDVVDPRAYDAFTQLAADRQFAQLGLVLIGVLAQVEAATAPLARREEVPEPAHKHVQPIAAAHDDDARGAAVPREAVAAPADAQVGGPDLGVAVSREALESPGRDGDGDGHRGEVGSSVERAPSPTSPLLSVKVVRDPETEKKRKKRKVESAASRVEKESESQAEPAELKQEKRKKKKKKKKGGDEFDDLFSSLI